MSAEPRRKLREEIERIIPSRMRARPVDHRGYCVPWFVHRTGPDSWDFRFPEPGKMVTAIRSRCCWLCGEPLGVFQTFVIGPMCAVNRTTSEPPSHRECAEFAVRACPFLALPNTRYRTANMPDDVLPPVGVGLMHNPTVCATWTTRGFDVSPVSDGILFRLLTEPDEVQFWHRGALATRAQVLRGMMIGLPLVHEMASKHAELGEFRRMLRDALRFVPGGTGSEEDEAALQRYLQGAQTA